MGILDDINTASGEGYTKNYVPEGIHKLLISKMEAKKGTASNSGKEWIIVNGTFLETSRADLPSCAEGMPFSIFIETAPDGYKMGPEKLKQLLLACATEEQLAGIDRSRVPVDCQKPNSAYSGQAKGMDWGEYLSMCLKHNAAEGCVVYVTAKDQPGKKDPSKTYTRYNFAKKGTEPPKVVPTLVTPPVQKQVQTPPAQVVTPAQQAVPTTQPVKTGGSLFA